MIEPAPPQGPAEGPEAALPRVAYQFPSQRGPGGLLALVGEAPGREEVKAGQPFVGRSGRLLDDHLRAAGIAREACLVANVFRLQPPDNKVGHFFASRARARRLGVGLAEALGRFGGSDYCLAAFAGEIEALRRTLTDWRPVVIVALGRTPLWALTGLGGILECRGRVQPCRLLPEAAVVPTYHPSYLLRGQRAAEPAFQADLALAAALAARGALT
jgi:DNA polymerase